MAILILQGPRNATCLTVARYYREWNDAARHPVEVLTCADLAGMERGLRACRGTGVEVVLLCPGDLAAELKAQAPPAFVEALGATGVPYIEIQDAPEYTLDLPADHSNCPLATVVVRNIDGAGTRMGLSIARHYLADRMPRLKDGGVRTINDADGGEHIRGSAVRIPRHGAALDDYELGGYAGI